MLTSKDLMLMQYNLQMYDTKLIEGLNRLDGTIRTLKLTNCFNTVKNNKV